MPAAAVCNARSSERPRVLGSHVTCITEPARWRYYGNTGHATAPSVYTERHCLRRPFPRGCRRFPVPRAVSSLAAGVYRMLALQTIHSVETLEERQTACGVAPWASSAYCLQVPPPLTLHSSNSLSCVRDGGIPSPPSLQLALVRSGWWNTGR